MQRGLAHVEVAHHPRSERCVAAAHPAERAADLAATPASLLALQRTAGNRAATAVAKQQLQRAVIAIDGATDTAGQKRATRACLENLTTRKGARAYPGGNARGRLEGPKVIGSIAIGADLLARESEDLYILGHGGADLQTVAGLTPTQLATRIRQWLAPMIATGKVFVGDIKLVACLSAAGSSPWSGGAVTPYAQALARALAPLNADDPIQPKFVTGIVGVGWVDETTGKQLSVDLGQYTAGPMTWAPSAAEATPGQRVDPFQAGDDRATRQAGIHAWFGAPVLVPVASGAGGAVPGLVHGKGPTGKRKFQVGAGTEIASPDYTQPRMVMDVSQYPAQAGI